MKALILLAALLSTAHPFHVSVCSINYASEERSLQITQKIFADDLEEALNAPARAAGRTSRIDVLNPPDPATMEAIIGDYLNEHLHITVNGEAVAPQFLGYEREDLALWCYLEVSEVTSVESVKVQSSILVDAFEDQTNIVHVKYQDAVKSMNLAKNNQQDQVTF